MKLSNSLVATLFTLALTAGCAAGTPEESSDLSADVRSDLKPLVSVSLNCGGSLPGFPKPPCLPDLVVSHSATQIVAPGGNIAPGQYMQVVVKNDSKAVANAFTVKVLDQTGAVLQTLPVAGLPGGGVTSLVVYGPNTCGWSRTIKVDTEGQIAEADESNNALTRSNPCQRALPSTIKFP